MKTLSIRVGKGTVKVKVYHNGRGWVDAYMPAEDTAVACRCGHLSFRFHAGMTLAGCAVRCVNCDATYGAPSGCEEREDAHFRSVC